MSEVALRSWAVDIDPRALEQAERTNRLDIITEPLALMPDAHWGMGSTIGSVIPTESAIIVAAVGCDLGCGMIAVQTNLGSEDLPDTMQPLVGEFSRSVPSGVGKQRTIPHQRALNWAAIHPHPMLDQRYIQQMGTLGSGNHFLEVCLDDTEGVWVILHSGSRGIGNKLAQGHINLAKALEQELEDPDLAYFTEGTVAFQSYIADMLWAQDYALENREIMMDEALIRLFRYVDYFHSKGPRAERPQEIQRINCHHNYAAREVHNGTEMWITRKGAIRARVGDFGVIPGSMATGSYIVRGLGNPDSYESAAHGAGRKMSRNQARKNLSVESLAERMDGKAWNADYAHKLVDEHPEAYKSIEDVMAQQADLVEVVHHLTQIVNYKGV